MKPSTYRPVGIFMFITKSSGIDQLTYRALFQRARCELVKVNLRVIIIIFKELCMHLIVHFPNQMFVDRIQIQMQMFKVSIQMQMQLQFYGRI